MTIRFGKYVQITSGVGGSSGVRQRDLIGRLFTTAAILSPGSVFEFTDPASVGEFFGLSSAEYTRAVSYFSFVSPGAFSAPRKLSFARYSPSGNGTQVYGGDPAALSQLVLATAGGLALIFNGGAAIDVSGVDLSAATSLADVATAMTTAIQASSVDPNVTAAVVSYDATAGRFVFSSNNIDASTVEVESTASGVFDLATALAWLPSTGALYVNGTAPQTPQTAFIEAANVSNNFGSFTFMQSLTIEQHATLAQLNTTYNVQYQYHVGVSRANYETWAAALAGFAGTGVTLSPFANEFPEMFPMIQLAATDYSLRDAVSTYMFKQLGGLTPSVTTDLESDTLDALRVNYYGETQTAGQKLSFYQRGFLMGGPTAPVDMNVYANEQWFRDHLGAALMSLLLSASRISANVAGRGRVLAVIQDSIDLALLNGTISVGKTLTAPQRADVTQRTGNPRAFYQIQSNGYWVDATIVPYVGPGGVQEYKIVYSIIYSKDDAIRFIQGTHSLI